MKTKICATGSYLGLVIYKGILEDANLKKGDIVSVDYNKRKKQLQIKKEVEIGNSTTTIRSGFGKSLGITLKVGVIASCGYKLYDAVDIRYDEIRKFIKVRRIEDV